MKKSRLSIIVISIFVVVFIAVILVLNFSKKSEDKKVEITPTPTIIPTTTTPDSQSVKENAQIILDGLKTIFTKESDQNIEEIANFDQDYFDSLELSSSFLNLYLSESEPSLVSENIFKVQLELASCENDLFFLIEFVDGKYKITDLDNLSEEICELIIKPTITYNNKDEIELNCLDCSLAPVDKKYKLKSDYTPKVVPVDLAGGGYVTEETKVALNSMFADAEENEIYIAITSSYRSYAMQEETFNYWVSTELAKGKSQYEAEVAANTYSAMPGHSEHQLGTVLDVRCLECSAFVANEANEEVYKYLEENAHKFGFVISYPPNSQQSTGYIYEPWHIRYIGIELATEIYELGYIKSNGGIYLAKFLEDKRNF